MKIPALLVSILAAGSLAGCSGTAEDDSDLAACTRMAADGFRPIADRPADRFLGKVPADAARCRGGERALASRETPLVDWAEYHATGDATSKEEGREAITALGRHLGPNGRGVDGALIDLEYQRVELIKFNLYDNDTYFQYAAGRDAVPGSALKVWEEMRLTPSHPSFEAVGSASRRHGTSATRPG